MRNLILVLGDQLTHDSSVFDGFDPACDQVWMAEVENEATHVLCHKLRLVLFFSAMRHFRDELRDRGMAVNYHELTADRSKDRGSSFGDVLTGSVRRLKPQRLIVSMPGDYRVLTCLKITAGKLNLDLDVRPDRHFYCGLEEFRDYAAGRQGLLLEAFYRHMRMRHHVLMNGDGKPVGGAWNFDRFNRQSLRRHESEPIPRPLSFHPDETTKEVIAMVQKRFSSHPGRLDHFGLPVTRRDARRMLADFIKTRLSNFGPFQDAMWTDEPFLYHTRLSTSLNLKLLNPRECIKAAVSAYESNLAPIQSVEGYVRQILGWREFMRGAYWLYMPKYGEMNALGHDLDVPSFYWDGNTEMNCMRQTMATILDHGYAHHIQRLMVVGLFALLLGVHPRKFHEWHMAMYLDAIDWVSLPNALGMSQYGDGGIVGTKPYCASGHYINKMSNYCRGCRYDPRNSSGEDACPFTTLYWDFLDRHRARFLHNARMIVQIRNLDRQRKNLETWRGIRKRAEALRKNRGRKPL